MPFSTLHELFYSQAARTPHTPAVITDRARLSFGELAARADRLAAGLRSRRFGPEALIGVCVGRSLDLPVCLLGVLRAGYAYLPLDPWQPAQRSARILAEARPALVIVDEAGDRLLGTADRAATITLHDLLESSGDAPVGSSWPQACAHSLAYVIYTSGSTGRPKGVEITHGAVVNTILEINKLCEVGSRDRLLNVSPSGFDLSVYDFFGLWAAGGAVVLIADSAYPNPRDWPGLMQRTRITLWNSAPALMEMVLDCLDRGADAGSSRLSCLRVAMLSGDRINPRLLQRLLRYQPELRILAMGGATEASIWSVHNWVEALAADSLFVPYGSALPNQATLVLDSELNEVPSGEVGYLYIGGAGLARAYRHRPDLTAAAFIPDPRAYGERLYFTGDRVRRLQAGNLEFLGRDDGQVKIRGFRVEIGEIERALLEIDTIERAAVTYHASARGAHLCAHLVMRHGCVPREVAALREVLSDRLPSYMIPERLLVLDSLPVTTNGKIDRAQLLHDCDAASARGPEGALQNDARNLVDGYLQSVRSAWQQVLCLQQINPSEHFLDLGGNSLLASQIVNRICESFRIEMTVRDLFENPTVAGFAALVAEQLESPRDRRSVC